MSSFKKEEVKEQKAKVLKMPHTYVLIFSIIIIVTILTYIVPAGVYDRVVSETTGKTVVDATSFHTVDSKPVSLLGMLTAIPRGMRDSAGIAFFILIVSGAFQIIHATGAIEKGIFKIAKRLKGKEQLLIPIFMLLFSITGAFMGFAEENLIFIPIAIALARAVGYDALVGVSLVTIGGAVGFNAAMMNPFTVGVAQGIAELPLFSGIGFRFVVWIVIGVISTIYVMRYGKKVRQNPELSLVAALEKREEEEQGSFAFTGNHKLEKSHYMVYLTVAAGFVYIIYGVYKLGWYFNEIAAIFLGMGLICGFIAKMSPSNMAIEFIEGSKQLIYGALVVGIARAILIIMQDGMILDSFIYGLSSQISNIPTSLAAIGMYLIQVVINFFVPSGSGQAAATMPIMVPLADVLGITRQTAVLAFQFGDGFSNSIIPTASTLMATLAMAKISYEIWVQYYWKLFAIWLVVGGVFIVIATQISYGPF